jgi:hypothetical protein
MPFEVTPFILYLTREAPGTSLAPPADAPAPEQNHFVLVPAKP